LENAVVLSQYHQAGTVWRQYYMVNALSISTWLDHLLLAGLVTIVPPLIAEKLFLSGYIVGVILSFAYCLKCFERHAVFCTALIFPFLSNYLFHMGFFGFCYSFIPFLLLIGFFYRHRLNFHPRHTAILLLLSLLVYLLHPISFMMAFVFVLVMCFLEALPFFASARVDPQPRFLHLLRRTLPVLPMLCVLALFPLFASHQPRGIFWGPGVLVKMQRLFSFYYLTTFNNRENYICILFAALFLALLIRGGKQLFTTQNVHRNLAIVPVIYCAIYLAFPNGVFGGGWINARLGLFTLLLFMLWIAANHRLWRFRLGVQVSAYVIAIGLLASHIPRYIELNDYLTEYLSPAPYIGLGSTLLPVSLAHGGKRTNGEALVTTGKMEPFLHAAGYISAGRGIVEFMNYEAGKGYFPIVYRPNLNPYVHLGDIEDPSSIRSLDFPAGSGGRADYILVWGRKIAGKAEANAAPLLRLISDKYELIHVSKPRGLAELWRRKTVPGLKPPDAANTLVKVSRASGCGIK
jgi:hypothetical protein